MQETPFGLRGGKKLSNSQQSKNIYFPAFFLFLEGTFFFTSTMLPSNALHKYLYLIPLLSKTILNS